MQTMQSNACESEKESEPPSLSISLSIINEQLNEIIEEDYKTLSTENLQILTSEKSDIFRTKYFPQSSISDWNNWQWQLKNRIKDLIDLKRITRLTDDEEQAIRKMGNHLPVGITPYYMSIMNTENFDDPIRKTMIPVMNELTTSEGESIDPLSEDSHSPVEGLVHRYPDRVLFLVTSFCATYCRYCTRARLVGQTGEYHFNQKQHINAINYIKEHKEIRDVLISGGDPLTMSDKKIEWLLEQLSSIPHIEFIRIGSKVPVVLPQRITDSLASILRKYQVWLSVHFMHPNEITPEVSEACSKLVDKGILLGSQTVLMKDVNDNVDIMKELMHKLLKIRVRPYYLYQCDPISGSSHMRTPVETGIKIIEGLRGHTTGYAIPSYVIDAPAGGGKIPLLPEYVVGRDKDYVTLRNFENKTFRYYDPIVND